MENFFVVLDYLHSYRGLNELQAGLVDVILNIFFVSLMMMPFLYSYFLSSLDIYYKIKYSICTTLKAFQKCTVISKYFFQFFARPETLQDKYY
jgi:hypothetical protein